MDLKAQLESLKSRVGVFMVGVVTKRVDRVLGRKFLVFPWLRGKWLARKIRIIERLVSPKCCCPCHA